MAGTTTPDNIPYPTTGDNLTPLGTWLTNIATGVQNALNLRARVHTAASFASLPTTGLTAGVSRGWATDTRRLFLWDGSKWVLIGGAIPYASVRVASDLSVGTAYSSLSAQSGGIASGISFTVPAGCGGIYDWGAMLRGGNTSNFYVQPFVNGSASGQELVSGGQDTLTGYGQLALNAGDVVNFRAKVFTGSTTISASTSRLSLAFRGGN